MDRPRDGAEDLRGDFPRPILRSDAHRIRTALSQPPKKTIAHALRPHTHIKNSIA